MQEYLSDDHLGRDHISNGREELTSSQGHGEDVQEGWDCSLVAQYLHIMCKALGSIPWVQSLAPKERREHVQGIESIEIRFIFEPELSKLISTAEEHLAKDDKM